MHTPASLFAQKEIVKVGGPNVGAGLTLSGVTAALTLPDSRLVVLDGAEPAVYLVHKSGKSSYKYGRQGSGPGEFRVPSKMELDNKGRIVIYDGSLMRFTWLEARGDSLVLLHSLNTEKGVQSFCFNPSGQIVGLSASTENPVLVFDIRERNMPIAKSIGHVSFVHELADNPLVRAYSTAGPVGCSTNSDRVLWHSSQIRSGELLSVNRNEGTPIMLSNFFQVLMTAPAAGGIRNSFPENGLIELIVGIRPYQSGSDFLMMSELQYKKGSRAPAKLYRFRTVNSKGEVSEPTASRTLLHYLSRGLAVCQTEEEEPELIVVRAGSQTYPCPIN